MVLCFGFRMRMKSITHWCFSCCWAVLTLSQGLVGSHTALPEKAAGAHGAGRDADQRDVPYRVALWWMIKLRVLAGGLLCSGTGWAPVTGGEQLRCALLVLNIFEHYCYILVIWKYITVFSLPFLSYQAVFIPTREFYLFSHPMAGQWVNGLMVLSCLLG